MATGGRRVCIVGAGMAGLCAARHALDHGMDVTVYEQADVIGGTWVYSENIAPGPFDDDVHSSLYENLRTNLPKEVMGFPDFPFPDHVEESFVTAEEVLKFLNSYADHFDLRKYIKFKSYVMRMRPRNAEWEVITIDLHGNKDTTAYFDFVFVCNGHYTSPLYPRIEGVDQFPGNKLHSHFYRRADAFKDEVVLVVGAGASGIDITDHVRTVAKRVLLSHHLREKPNTTFMRNVEQKPEVVRIDGARVQFKDGSSDEVDAIIFCTGYNTTFPFLAVDCGLRTDNNYVQPLYKHCININNPTMTVVGIPYRVCPAQLYDMQVRFALKYYSGQRQLPTRQQMLADTERDMNERWARGLTKRQAHMMGTEQQFHHYRDLAETAGITNIRPVIEHILRDCSQKYIFELDTYRKHCFRIIDDELFVKYTMKN